MTGLGIVAAFPAEVKSLVGRRISPGGRIKVNGGGWLQLAGLGPERAKEAAESLVDAGAIALVSWGIAGGLDMTLSRGSLLLPKTIIASDQKTYSVDVAWHSRLLKCLTGHVDLDTGDLAEWTAILTARADKGILFEQTGAVAVDMESGAVAEAAHRAVIPFVAIRAIVDTADTPTPPSAARALAPNGRLQGMRLLLSLIRHPADVVGLYRLGIGLRAAKTTLAAAVNHAGPLLQAPVKNGRTVCDNAST